MKSKVNQSNGACDCEGEDKVREGQCENQTLDGKEGVAYSWRTNEYQSRCGDEARDGKVEWMRENQCLFTLRFGTRKKMSKTRERELKKLTSFTEWPHVSIWHRAFEIAIWALLKAMIMISTLVNNLTFGMWNNVNPWLTSKQIARAGVESYQGVWAINQERRGN